MNAQNISLSNYFTICYCYLCFGSDLDLLYALDEKVTYWCAPDHPVGGDVRWAVIAMVGCAGMLIPWKSANAINTNQHVLSCFADCSDLSK